MGNDTPDNQTLVELVQQHYAVLYRYAYRLTGNSADAEDVTQQTFLTAQKKLGQLRETAHARSWLCTIARNAFLKTLRSPSATPVSLEAAGEPEHPEPADIPIDSERLQNALNTLPEDFRTPLILYYFQEFSYKDIARQMDLPMGTVMSRLARGKAVLRRRLASSSLSAAPSVPCGEHDGHPAGAQRESRP